MGQQSSKSELPSEVVHRLAEIDAARARVDKLFMSLHRLSQLVSAEKTLGIPAMPDSAQERYQALQDYLRRLDCEMYAILDCASECRPCSLL